MSDFYSKNAAWLTKKYESVSPEKIHDIWLSCLPETKALILDIGAGSGRDAAWLAEKGHEVIAVEPSDGMRKKARRLHLSSSIKWIKDSLPELKKIRELKQKFDIILLSAVWIHVLPEEREAALKNLSCLLRADGHLIISLRQGEPPDERVMHQCTIKEMKNTAKKTGWQIIKQSKKTDGLNRKDVSWEIIILTRKVC